MSVPVCCKCNEEIRPRAICTMGKAYHPHHFTCRDCRKVVDPNRFFAIKDEVLCSDCYLHKHAAKCFVCRTPIVERAIVAAGRKWHEKCFRCVSCSKSLVSGTFFEINGYLFCKLHFQELFSSRCSGCGEAIVKSAVVALSTKWHADCFKCYNCLRPIVDSKFNIDQKGRPVCIECCSKESSPNTNLVVE